MRADLSLSADPSFYAEGSSGTRLIALLLVTLVLTACGGGGSGRSVASVSAPVGQALAPPNAGAQQVAYAEADEIVAYIQAVTIPQDGRAQVDFQLTDTRNYPITDFVADNLRLTIAKLGGSPVGNLTGAWQSYLNSVEMPEVGIGTEPRLQAITESATEGALTNNSDGTYRYRFAASVNDAEDQAVLNQATIEGLNLAYQPERLHRVGLEFRNARQPSNATHDWIPATGVTEAHGVYRYDVVATMNCNGCHNQLSAHGGSRIESRYCVTCHNPGTTDPDSTNTVAFKTMIHKIHRGSALPSVAAGTPYVIYGRNNAAHDYSNVAYPRDIGECVVCHGGNATATAATRQVTDAGDNWSVYATRESCGSCHDDLDFANHYGGQPDDENCMSCHQTIGVAGSIADSHLNQAAAASSSFQGNVLSVTNTAPGARPVIRFSVTDPTSGDAPYDILNDPQWTASSSSLSVRVAWSTGDYTNSGSGSGMASSVSINALTTAVAIGDGSFEVASAIAIPDGTLPPNIAASGSGAVTLEMRPVLNSGTTAVPVLEQVAVPSAVGYFSIDEADGTPVPRRVIADQDGCLGCHGQLVLHGNNRTDTIEMCVTCHNPRHTDKLSRDMAAVPPTDGKAEESLDFKTMIHGIHAAAFRTEPLQIVGRNGVTTYVYDAAHIQYPGEISDCRACHVDGSYALPLADTVLAPTRDSGAGITDPADDRVISTQSAVCSSCHDSATAISHMTGNGGSFDTTQAAINGGDIVEQCVICHGAGRVEDVEVVHGL